MDTRATRRRWAGLAAVALLAACGGGDGGGDGESSAGAAAPVVSDASAPPSPTADAPVAPATCGNADFVAETLARVNAQRARGADCGVRGVYGPAPPLAWNNALAAAATAHSQDMATRDYFSHDSPEGHTLQQRVESVGYAWRGLAENIAAGYRSMAAVTDAWIDSDGHCANVLNPSLTEIGMACVAATGARYSTYWTMDLGRPR